MIFKIYRIDKDVRTKNLNLFYNFENLQNCPFQNVVLNHTFTSLIYYSLSSGIWISYELLALVCAKCLVDPRE